MASPNTTIPSRISVASAGALLPQVRARHAAVLPPCQLAHPALIAALAAETPHAIVGHEADRFDVLERADHLKAINAAVYAYNKVIVGDTKDYTSVVIHDETGFLNDAASEINGAFMNDLLPFEPSENCSACSPG